MVKILNQERGFSLVEAIVALAILVMMAAGIGSVFVAGLLFNSESEDRTIAANIAQLKVEELMNTRFRYIVAENPPGVTRFDSKTQSSPYWTLNSRGVWIPSLPEGEYEIGYPDGVDADPLRIKVTISWRGHIHSQTSLSLETLVSMTPGRFRG